MKDQADNQTSELFPAPRRRGRPSTGQAKTASERMREYRLRKKADGVEKSLSGFVTENITKIRDMETELNSARAENERLKHRLSDLELELRKIKGQLRLVIEERDEIEQRGVRLLGNAELERARLNREIEKLKKRNVTKRGGADVVSVLVSCFDGAISDNRDIRDDDLAKSYIARSFVARLSGALLYRPEHADLLRRINDFFPHLSE
ncbi:hypothetical protein [Methylocaldum gracile]|jgi:predicted RNase H-like nuclease (RuvC/YqgF family)|uniref:hypothetical protein n=1 Tax=Methylocaldum sp. 0917 TaxID=2485163 RepID=UPI00105B4C98